MSTTTDDCELSLLESLPGEILNTIYRYTVVERGFVDAVKGIQAAIPTPRQHLWTWNEPPLARTCRRFRKEVLPIYYSENTFQFRLHPCERTVFESIARFKAWITSIGESASYIRRVGGHAKDCWPLGERKTDGPDMIVNISQDREQAEFSLLEEGLEHVNKARVLNNAYECWKAVPTQIRKLQPVAIALVICERLLCGYRPRILARSMEAVIRCGGNRACNDQLVEQYVKARGWS